jgi:hypothetical protein
MVHGIRGRARRGRDDRGHPTELGWHRVRTDGRTLADREPHSDSDSDSDTVGDAHAVPNPDAVANAFAVTDPISAAAHTGADARADNRAAGM